MSAAHPGTMAEKIMSRAIGHEVRAGAVIYPQPDLVTVHDLYALNFHQALEQIGVDRLFAPEKVLICTDHEPVALSVKSALRQQAVRALAAKYGVGKFYDAGRGGHGHVFPIEDGLVKPGQFVLAYDMHVTNYGAVGALGIYVGNEISEVLALGSVWLQVPQTVRVNLTGRAAPGVTMRDVSQWIVAELGDERLNYAVVEYGGEALSNIGIGGRMTLCNTPMESSAKSAIVEPDEVIEAWYAARQFGAANTVKADAGAQYRHILDVDISTLGPQVAPPPNSTSAVDVALVAGTRINHAFVGSCANCSLDDLRDTAKILRGRRIAPGVRMVITPGTQTIAAEAAREGLLSAFIEAGVSITAPGCGVCASGALSPIAPGEVSINTGTVNHPGRLGATDADIYLASPLTVAASAVKGVITDPREFL